MDDFCMEFFVEGTPVAQGSKSAFPHPKTGKVMIVEKSYVKWRAWRDSLSYIALSECNKRGHTPLDGPIELEVTFLMAKPKSVKRVLPAVRPDWDKLVRAVCDAMTGIIYLDDAQIVTATVKKRYAEAGMRPGALVCVKA